MYEHLYEYLLCPVSSDDVKSQYEVVLGDWSSNPQVKSIYNYEPDSAIQMLGSPGRTFRCPEQCSCPEYPRCQDGVPVVVDGCGCCPVCARQQGDVCNSVHVCDATRKLQCTYVDSFFTTGICRVRRGQGCHVGDRDYRDGDTFKLDCRTQCTCQNGTYGCVSLCPQESVHPSAECHRPRLVEVQNGGCCREWMCESTLLEDRRKHCQTYTGDWTPCSTTCGMGVSSRISNANPECQLKNETRLCMLRPCPKPGEEDMGKGNGHHRNHVCRATMRGSSPIRLTAEGNCTSLEPLLPKFCGHCTDRHCCLPKVTTNRKVQFQCDDEEGHILVQKDFMWILKCDCSTAC
ncbi:hypothetical protein JTE90_017868 [Oedothorax gibbosus]|uniref:Uncharacterized protein n=1 Tax=Oedothorax gibbosus TaxID=931172 RepID=A0AAV6V1Z8_9ARAC|nr:hypothetical protein JTE90_017868 [Oedothorax gibbosus]